MTKPHKWAKEIKAWADGAEIECREIFSNGDYTDWWIVHEPEWDMNPVTEYRLKPQPKEAQHLYVYKAVGGEIMLESKLSSYCGECIGKIKLETDDGMS